MGRFQPPHAAHVGSVQHALKHAPRVLVLVGSANLARSVHNPWSAPERTGMFRSALRDGGADVRRVTFRPLPDDFDAERWAAAVREQAAAVFGPAAALALGGFEKDASSAYLRWFPGWSRLNVPQTPGLNATDLRRVLFGGQALPAGVPAAVQAFLSAFVSTPAFARLQAEWQAVTVARAALPPGLHLTEERWLWRAGERVALHTRLGPIGRGLWELPGCQLPPGEQPRAGAEAVFAHPARSLVAPAAAHVFLGVPPPAFGFHSVPLATALARPRRFFEDHHVILTRLLGLD
ncbi:bifunctional nicotinamide mononucleotide adenylyltransferase/ADP-ribose pyrophosphatase [Deinococcus aerolatus]|uniref:Bifunctional nicotinamide mononucleotide adenylyltransferase/ADP-ribose pyrophosphatase n=1 Tax=Deinococcus aerolatus TaxID=522487 RepID=A0ABQ2G4Z5_9DEIO|nr:bifunctional nicotinamide mononucleotide adenylyltransferase/ADP-ribose pyrophosphatase [Deinococcus aerolatus]